jgi:hypothetical protein
VPRQIVSDEIKCRAFGHAWDQVPSEQDSRELHIVSRCIRCLAKKTEWLGWDGKVIQRWYDLTDKYHEVTHVTRAEAKLQIAKPSPRARVVKLHA